MASIKHRLRSALHRKGPWPIVVLVAIGALAFTLIALFAPADTREALFGANGLVMAILGLMMRSPLADDSSD